VFLSSHVLSEIQAAADVVAILRAGELIRTATVAELRAQ
jgi:ABC-2 type transport system ATP-binding protein